jgi:putative SOS response-associated peptidase YedK
MLAVVRDRGGDRRAVLAGFGVAPVWAKLRGGPSLNTRDDNVGSSGAWKPLVRSAAHRAMIIADGYYHEWQKPEDPKQPKQPIYHRLVDGQPFAFAGAVDDRHPETSCPLASPGCR